MNGENQREYFYLSGKNPEYDRIAKKLLSSRNILAWILKYCVEEFRDSDIADIRDSYILGTPEVASTLVLPDQTNTGRIVGEANEDISITEGLVTFDIRFRAITPENEAIGLIVNIEAQKSAQLSYPLLKRAIYYCSRLISSQHGVDFEKSHYEKIKKVYSIFICMNPPVYRKNTINCYSMQEKNMIGNVKEKRENYDLLTAVMICLGNKIDEADTGILRLLEVLLSSERQAEEKKQILQRDYGIKMTESLESEVTEMCDLSKGVEERGIQKGIQKGIQRAAQNLMKNMKLSFSQAMDALGIPEDEREKYRESVKK